MNNFADKVVVVTGASHGIGAAMASAFAADGATVIATFPQDDARTHHQAVEIWRNEAGIDPSRVLPMAANADKAEQVAAMYAAISEQYDGVDILVNNAGINQAHTIAELSNAEWRAAIALNLDGAFFNSRSAIPLLRDGGRIINISSIVTHRGDLGVGNYAISKDDLIGLTKTLAVELASRNITANAVCPGFGDIDINNNIPKDVFSRIGQRIPLKRRGEVADVVACVLFLASESAGFVTGQSLDVDGGLHLGRVGAPTNSRPSWNPDTIGNVSDLALHENLRHQVAVRPNKVAMVYEDKATTFRQLHEMACRIAHALNDQGIGPGDHVGIFLRNHWSYIPIYYALSMSGIVAVPVNYMLRGEQLEALLDLTDCSFMFTEMSQYDELRKLRSNAMGRLSLCFVDDGPEQADHRLADWVQPDRPCGEPHASVAIDDSMMILFSSGTTDLPKGILLSHLNRVLYFFQLGMEYGIRYNEVNLCTTPLYHNAAIFFALNNLYFGSTTVVHRKFDVERTFRDIERFGVTNAFFVPTQLHQLMQSDMREHYDLSSLRIIVSGAAPLATATKEAILKCFPGIELHELYGLTETGLITNLRPEDQLRKVRCAGQAFLNMQFRIVDEVGKDVQTGEVGEVVTRGPTLFDGYCGNEKATKAAWKNGWFHTGDLGKTDEEGFLYIVDRLKDMILSGGVNIYPKDIEDVIYTLAGVADVGVIGIPDDKWGEVVHAIVVCRDDAVLTENDVISTCRAKLAEFQIPQSIEFRSELPRNPSGKLLKRVLRAEFL